jgi:hypothetical protein
MCWGEPQIDEFIGAWIDRVDGWFVCLSDSELLHIWRRVFEAHGLVGFQPVPICIRGMTVRLAGDGPSSWAVYANVARKRGIKYGTAPGFLYGSREVQDQIGGKPLWAMEELVRLYSRPGNTICDPMAGAATTLIAAGRLGRTAVGAEIDPIMHETGIRRIDAETQRFIDIEKEYQLCGRCRKTYSLDGFARDRTAKTGHQTWCKKCKAVWAGSMNGSWKTFQKLLKEHYPEDGQLWSQRDYEKRWKHAKGACESCGAGLSDWQMGGYRIDRIDNTIGYRPGNCRLCCWPCNKFKRDMHPTTAEMFIKSLVDKWGWGRVPWNSLFPSDGFARKALPDMSQFTPHGEAHHQLELMDI